MDTSGVYLTGMKRQTKSIDQRVAEAQQLVRSYVPKGVSLVDELLIERRAEHRPPWTPSKRERTR